MSNLKAKRDRNEIFAQVLKLCVKPTPKTRIMHQTNTSYDGLQRLLKQLQNFELLIFEEGTRKYATT